MTFNQTPKGQELAKRYNRNIQWAEEGEFVPLEISLESLEKGCMEEFGKIPDSIKKGMDVILAHAYGTKIIQSYEDAIKYAKENKSCVMSVCLLLASRLENEVEITDGSDLHNRMEKIKREAFSAGLEVWKKVVSDYDTRGEKGMSKVCTINFINPYSNVLNGKTSSLERPIISKTNEISDVDGSKRDFLEEIRQKYMKDVLSEIYLR